MESISSTNISEDDEVAAASRADFGAMPVRNLATYDHSRHDPGRGSAWRAGWYFLSLMVFESGWFPLSRLKCAILRSFGARIGCGVVIKPNVRIKYPWKLTVGDHSWIGQDAWIDNLADVKIGDDVCISQGAYLCTGGHDYRTSEFDLIDRPIQIDDGAWIGARAVLLPGVYVGEGSVVGAGSVVGKPVACGVLVAGSPAQVVRRLVGPPRQPR